jgi:hypothetical protein
MDHGRVVVLVVEKVKAKIVSCERKRGCLKDSGKSVIENDVRKEVSFSSDVVVERRKVMQRLQETVWTRNIH